MKNKFVIILLLFCILSCEEKAIELEFKETAITPETEATIEINLPIASGNKTVAQDINNSIETLISTSLSLTDEVKDYSLDEAITAFDKEYKIFKNDFPESEQQWEALIDSELIYKSPEIISISINTYIDTGGAHGNTNIVFLNFDPNTGRELSMDDIVIDIKAFEELVKKHFKAYLENRENELDVSDSFYGDEFTLPETIGFSEEGLIILYNTYEIAAYSFGITEFTIPFKEVSEIINRR